MKEKIPQRESVMNTVDSGYITAIDIGTTKIVAIIGRKNKKNKIEVVGIGSVPIEGEAVKRGVVLNIAITAEKIIEAVRIAEESSGVKFSNVFVGIAGQHIKSRPNSHSFMSDEAVEITSEHTGDLLVAMGKYNIEHGQSIIHVIPQSYTVDLEQDVKNPEGMCGKKLTGYFHIVICDIIAKKNIEKAIERAGLKPQELILEPIASASAVLTEDEKEAGVALVDIGGGTTDLAIFHKGSLVHTSVIPLAGNLITSDIQSAFNILKRYAETLKVGYGCAVADYAPENTLAVVPGISGRSQKEIDIKELSKIIQARVEEIIENVIYEIESAGYMDKLGAGIAITGGGASLKHITSLMQFMTGKDVKLAHPRNYISEKVDSEVRNPVYSTSVGLLITGNEILEQQARSFDDAQKRMQSKEQEILPKETVKKTEKIDNVVEIIIDKEPKGLKKFIKSISTGAKELFGDTDETSKPKDKIIN